MTWTSRIRRGRAAAAVVAGCLLGLSGCASIGRPVEPPATANSQERHRLASVPPVRQRAYQCGPAALESVIRHWGEPADAEAIGALLSRPGTRGVLNFALAQYAWERGFWTEMRPATPEELKAWIRKGLPPIVSVRVGPFGVPLYHYVVVTGFDDRARLFYAQTGAARLQAIAYPQFLARWQEAQCWSLLICPPDRVNWALDAERAAALALLLERSGRFDLAESWYQEALRQQPESEPIQFNLANLYLKTARLAEAKTMFRALRARQPGHAPFSNNLAWIALEEGRPREALQIIEAAFRHGAEPQPDLLDTLGLAYCRLRQCRKASACFLEALDLVPPERDQVRQVIQAHLDGCRAAP